MEIAAGAMRPLLAKLGGLLLDEYNLKKRVKKGIRSLLTELEMMHAVLLKVDRLLPDQLDEEIQIWASKVRELSYNMEDAVDAFLVHVEGGHDHGPPPTNIKNRIKKFLKKTTALFSKGKTLHKISHAIGEAQDLAKELGELRQKYMLEMHTNYTEGTIDPRLKALYKDATKLVGIDDTRYELIKKLCDGDEDEGLEKQLKIMSVVGFGGLGKTTLAKSVYEEIKTQFDCGAFVSVSRNPNMKKVFSDMLYKLDKEKFGKIHNAGRDEKLLIDELREFLKDKRYIIVIDDIWDEQTWEIIKCIFSTSSLGSRVITTTRIMSVAKACCTASNDMICKMKPLTDGDSERLFYKIIFPQRSDCPHELEQVSREILKKCGGVPLAIITIASLLASNDEQIKPEYQWNNVLNSIGRGLSQGGSAKEMQRILSFSYYDLPSHLKNCLLYLSIFPEDTVIRRDRLIWRWIAEGFVQVGNKETGLYELGENYFSELINRNMIQPVDVDFEGRAGSCRVHDMVLDLICSLASEEKFVTILGGNEQSIPTSQRKLRRLSFQNNMSEVNTPQLDTTNMSRVRSITLFRTVVDLIQCLSCFQFLRVLDLEGCNLEESGHNIHLRYVEKLLHLRYLGLKDTCVGKLPMEIGKLRFLQTLDLRGSRAEMPSTVVRLRHLICLYVDRGMTMPVGMGNLVSIEELTTLRVDDVVPGIEKELTHLMKMRVLNISLGGDTESICKSLVVSIGNMQRLESLTVGCETDTKFDLSWNGWVPPPHLRTLVFARCTSTLPSWINMSSLPLLSRLDIVVDEVRLEDIEILGMMPALLCLWLGTTKAHYSCAERVLAGADLFPFLRECRLVNFATTTSLFPRGAMPRLQILRFYARASDIGSGALDVGIGHLPSLQRVEVLLWCPIGSENVEELAEAALRLAADAHPNRPTLDIGHYLL